MNELCTDIGFMSLNKHGEELCGDHVELANEGEYSQIAVLADGMGSGVKASILSTLTSKIISTMLSEGMSIENCVETIAAALPVCSVRQVAYSTFTIIRIINGEEAEIIQYDNPKTILLRGGQNYELVTENFEVYGKKMWQSRIKIQEGDIFLAMSDGVPHAGIGLTLNLGWKRSDIIEYLTTFTHVGFTSKTLCALLLDECDRLYDGKPGDDTTVCCVRIRKTEKVNLVMGPASHRLDDNKMMSLFFESEGKHIVCGGTTSNLAAAYLRESVIPSLKYYDKDIPPTAKMRGADLMTEGVITMNRVLDYARDYAGENQLYKNWCYSKDGASLIARMLFEEATDINFFVGMAINAAHQKPDLNINFSIKMRLIDELAQYLKAMGKKVKLSYF